MTGFELDEITTKKIEKFLDLEEKEIKIYISLLSLGNVGTLGQISMVAGLDILVTNAALEGLSNKGYIMQHKGKISRYYALEPFLESYIKLFDPMGFLTLIRNLSKSLENSPLGLIDDAEMFNQYLKNNLTKKKEELLKNQTITEDNIKIINNVVDESVKIIADTAFSIIQDMEEKGKKLLQKNAKKFQNDTNVIFKSITDARDSFVELFKISRDIKVPANFEHDVLVGESSILIALRDIITRSKNSLLIFMPLPEIKSLMNLVELSQRLAIKIDVIGNVNKTPSVILEKIKNEGIGINLRQLDQIDFWAVIMDEEEFLFAPNPKNEIDQPITGIFTTYKPIISHYSETLRKYIMRASPL